MNDEVTVDSHNIPADATLSDIIQLLTNYRCEMTEFIEKKDARIAELEEENRALLSKVRELKSK